MKVDHSYRDDQIQPRHFEKLARRCEFSASEMIGSIISMAERMPEHARQIVDEMQREGVKHVILEKLLEKLLKRSQRISESFSLL